MAYKPGQRVQVLMDRYLQGKSKGVWARAVIEHPSGREQDIDVTLEAPVQFQDVTIEGTIQVHWDEIVP